MFGNGLFLTPGVMRLKTYACLRMLPRFFRDHFTPVFQTFGFKNPDFKSFSAEHKGFFGYSSCSHLCYCFGHLDISVSRVDEKCLLAEKSIKTADRLGLKRNVFRIIFCLKISENQKEAGFHTRYYGDLGAECYGGCHVAYCSAFRDEWLQG